MYKQGDRDFTLVPGIRSASISIHSDAASKITQCKVYNNLVSLLSNFPSTLFRLRILNMVERQ